MGFLKRRTSEQEKPSLTPPASQSPHVLWRETDESKKWKARWYQTQALHLELTNPLIPGWFTPNEGRFLMGMATLLPKGAFAVEIGSLCGKSTRWFLTGCVFSDSNLLCIDPFTGSENELADYGTTGEKDEFYKQFDQYYRGNTRGLFEISLYNAFGQDPYYRSHLAVYKGYSQNAVEEWEKLELPKIDLLFIDGGHWRCRKDVEAFLPYCKDHVLILLHDVSQSAPYGVDGPTNTYMSMLHGGWQKYGGAELVAAVTREPQWWDTRGEAIRDYFGDPSGGGSQDQSTDADPGKRGAATPADQGDPAIPGSSGHPGTVSDGRDLE